MVTRSCVSRLALTAAVVCTGVLIAGVGGAPLATSAVSLMSLPGTPGAPEVIAGDTRAIVAVPEPATGAAPEGYVVTASPGGNTCTIPGSAPLRVCAINALTNGVAYTFTAVATTGAGTSPASAASNSITPGDMLAYDAALTLTANDNIGNVMVMDPAGEFLLIGVRSTPGRITKVNLPDMTVEAVLTLNAGENDLASGAIDGEGHYAYFGTMSSEHIVQIDSSTMTRVGRVSLEAGENRAQRLVFDSARDVLYAVMYSDPGRVATFSPSPLARLSTVTLPALARYPRSAVMGSDGRFLYVGNSNLGTGGHVSRVDLDNFAGVGAVSDATLADGTLTSMVAGHDDHLYMGTETDPGHLLKVSTSALTREATFIWPAGQSSIYHAAASGDRRQAYFSTNISPSSTLSKFDLAAAANPGYASVSSITLPVAVTQVASMAMDPFGHRLYIGSNNTPAMVVAVTVGPAPRRLPAPPQAVAATASATTAEVTWQAPADTGGLTLQGYAVEQATTHSGPWTPAAGGCALASTRASLVGSCEATGLGNQDYVFRVAARTTGGQGAWTSTSAVVTPTGSTTTVPVVRALITTVPVTTTTVPPPISSPTTTVPDIEAPAATSIAPGVRAQVTHAVVNGRSVTVDGEALMLNVEPVACDGTACGVSLDGDGRPTITLSQNGRVRVSGDGFQPGTLAQVWMFSEPVFLGALSVGSDGSFGGELDVPPVAPGEHVLQVHGLTPDGESRSAELGLRVLAVVEELPATGTDVSVMWAMSAVLAVAGVVLWLRPRRFGRVPVRRQASDQG